MLSVSARIRISCCSFQAVVADARGASRRRADQTAELVEGGQPDEAVDDPRGRVRLSELEPDDPGDEVELRDGDETPIEASDDDQRACGEIERIHCCTPSVEGL